MMLLVLLVVVFPEQVVVASWWYLHHVPQIIAVAFVLDVVFWVAAWRRYRRKHPYQPVKLV
jgi:hypothetical protein